MTTPPASIDSISSRARRDAGDHGSGQVQEPLLSIQEPSFAPLLLQLVPVGAAAAVGHSEGAGAGSGNGTGDADGEVEGHDRGDRSMGSKGGGGADERCRDLPMTIHSLNEMLLTGHGAATNPLAQPAAPNVPAPAPARENGERRVGRADGNDRSEPGESGAGEGSKGHGEVKEQSPKAPDPLAPLARAAEVQRGVDGGRGAGAPSESVGQGPVKGQAIAGPGAAPVGGLAVGAATAAAPAKGGATSISGVGPIAQGTARTGTVLRVGVAPKGQPVRRAEDPDVFRAQVSRTLAKALEKGQGTVLLRLKPEALGKLHIKVSMNDGVMTARFEAETIEARDLLVSTVGELRRSLEAAGVNVERIEAAVSPQLRHAGQDGAHGGVLDPTAGHSAGEWPGGAGDGGGDPAWSEPGSQRGTRDTDVAHHSREDGATAEPEAADIIWLAAGVDMIA